MWGIQILPFQGDKPTSSAPAEFPSQSVHAIPSTSVGPLLLQNASLNFPFICRNPIKMESIWNHLFCILLALLNSDPLQLLELLLCNYCHMTWLVYLVSTPKFFSHLQVKPIFNGPCDRLNVCIPTPPKCIC